MTTTTIMREAALELAARGYRIFPCRCREKKPLIDTWQTRATTDPNYIKGWWAKSAYNIGLATGEGSRVWALDVDGPEGEETLRKLEAEHGVLPATLEATTGKGRHLYFAWPSGVTIRNSQCRLPGLDWRGDGGYTLAPPSVHPTGRAYAWSADSAATAAAAPDWLLDLVTKRIRDGAALPGASPEAWCSFLSGSFDGSHRGAAIARLVGLLLRKYLDLGVATDLVRMFNDTRCKPPLDSDEVCDIVDAIWSYEQERRALQGSRS